MGFWDAALAIEEYARSELEYDGSEDEMLLFHPEKGFKPNKGGQAEFFGMYPIQEEPPNPFPAYRWQLIAGGIGCLAGETEINGISMRELTETPIRVQTLMGEQWATPAYVKGQANLYRVTMRSGKSVLATKEHRFLCFADWLPLQQLGCGDSIACFDDKTDLSYWDVVESIEYVRYDDFYDLHVPVGNHYLANGIWHHNSGKSKLGAIWVILHSLWYPRSRGIITAVSYPQLTQSTLVTLVETCRQFNIPLEPYREAVEENAIAIGNLRRCSIGEQRAFWRVLSMASFSGKTQSSRGQEVAAAWVDEGAYATEQSFLTLDGRLRSSRGEFCKGIITTSPAGFNWIWHKFVDPTRSDDLKSLYNSVVCKTIENEEHLGEDYVSSLKSNYTDELSRQELDAEFLNTQVGLVFKAFSRSIHAVTGDEAELVAYDSALPLHLAFDFNYSPAVCVLSQVKHNEIHVFKEIYLMDSDIWELAETVADWIREADPMTEDIFVYGDASGAQRSIHSRQSAWDVIFDQLKVCGRLHRRFPKANPPIRNRINSANCIFKQKRLFIHKEACPELIKDFEQVSWSGEGIDKSDLLRSHLADALTYQVEYLFPYKQLVKPRMGQRQIPGVVA